MNRYLNDREQYARLNRDGVLILSDHLVDEGRIPSDFRLEKVEHYECGGAAHWILVYRHERTGLLFSLIPGGTYLMGSLHDEEGRFSNEHQHERSVPPALVCQTPVTQEAWERGGGENRSHFRGPKRPVESISWFDATRWCEAVNLEMTCEVFWEYAARAGTQTRFPFGDDAAQLARHAWYIENSNGETHPVGELLPNAFGLYDTLGLVWEWQSDKYHEDPREAADPFVVMKLARAPTASSGAAAGATTPGTAARRSATGARPAAGTATSGSEPTVESENPDPPVSGSGAGAGAVGGRQSTSASPSEVGEPPRRSGMGMASESASGSESPDPTASSGEVSAVPGPAPASQHTALASPQTSRTTSLSTPASSGTCPSAQSDQQGGSSPDPPLSLSGATAGSTTPGAAVRRFAAGARPVGGAAASGSVSAEKSEADPPTPSPSEEVAGSTPAPPWTPATGTGLAATRTTTPDSEPASGSDRPDPTSGGSGGTSAGRPQRGEATYLAATGPSSPPGTRSMSLQPPPPTGSNGRWKEGEPESASDPSGESEEDPYVEHPVRGGRYREAPGRCRRWYSDLFLECDLYDGRSEGGACVAVSFRPTRRI